MKEKHFNVWQEARAVGKQRYILFHGVIGYGLTMFVMMAVFIPMLQSLPLFHNKGFSFELLLVVVTLGLVCGYLLKNCIPFLISGQYLRAFLWASPLPIACILLMSHPQVEPPNCKWNNYWSHCVGCGGIFFWNGDVVFLRK